MSYWDSDCVGLPGDTLGLLGYPVTPRVNRADELTVTDVVYQQIPDLPRGYPVNKFFFIKCHAYHKLTKKIVYSIFIT